MQSAVADALALCQGCAADEELAMTSVWTVSKLADAAENLKQIHDSGAQRTASAIYSSIIILIRCAYWCPSDGVATLAPIGQKFGGDTAYLACKVVAMVASEDWAEAERILPGLELLVARLREEPDDVWALAILATSKLVAKPEILEAMLERGLVDATAAVCESCTDTSVGSPLILAHAGCVPLSGVPGRALTLRYSGQAAANLCLLDVAQMRHAHAGGAAGASPKGGQPRQAQRRVWRRPRCLLHRWQSELLF